MTEIAECPSCQAAEKDRNSGLYHASCQECKIRAVANGRELFEARKAGKITPEYKQTLQGMFGDGWEVAQKRVCEWRDSMKGMKT